MSTRRPGPQLTIDTSQIKSLGGSKSRQEEEDARRAAQRARTEAKVRQEQERLIRESSSEQSLSSEASTGGLGSETAGVSHSGAMEVQQQQQQDYYGRNPQQQSQQQNGMHIDEGTDEEGQEGEEEDDEDRYGEDARGRPVDHAKDDIDMHGDENEEMMDEEEDDLSSSPSVPDENIDFDLVYALHTFLATVEGQASVVKGDQLTLLDDSNSYWWLVRVLKTQAVGYIPAENIETPYERLARLNKHRNVDIAFATQEDLLTGTGSSLAQTRFAQPHHPTNRALQAHADRPPVQLNPALAGGGRFVDFAPPIYHEHEGYFYGTDESMTEGSEGSFEGGSLEDQGQAEFEDDEDEEEEGGEDAMEQDGHEDAGATEEEHTARMNVERPDESIDESPVENTITLDRVKDMVGGAAVAVAMEQRSPLQAITPRAAQVQQQAALGVANGQRPGQSVSPPLNRKLSLDEQLAAERDAAHLAQSRDPTPTPASVAQQLQPQSQGMAQRSPSINSSSSGSSRLKPFPDENVAETSGSGELTRKVSLTPKIARDDSVESNLSDRSGPSVQGQQQKPGQQRQPLRSVSISTTSSQGNQSVDMANHSTTSSAPTDAPDPYPKEHQRRESAGSAASSTVSSNSARRGGAVSPSNENAGKDAGKKKKSTGILGGLFSRKKDKGDKKAGKDAGGRMSIASASDDERGSNASPAPDSPDRNAASGKGGEKDAAQRKASQQAREEMFGTDAALRQQQVEAQAAMYHQYGIHPRAPGDVSNTQTFSNQRQSAQQSPSSQLQQLPPPQKAQGSSLASASMASNGSGGSAQSSLNGKPRRPGSLVGSPHMPGTSPHGGEVPVLSVMRVFAGDNIVSEATFKTILLNESTTTEDLVKQAMQRFRLAPPTSSASSGDANKPIMEEFYLTAKDDSGEETVLAADQNPLKVFEALSQASGLLQVGQGLPSVKRSSVGSINSISSNLSMNPAIERLRMSDFSDDSAVKFFIHKRTPVPSVSHSNRRASLLVTATADEIDAAQKSEDTSIDPHRLSASSIIDKGAAAGMPSSPLFRFAAKVIIQPSELPESMVFDPLSHALIPKSTLNERLQQQSQNSRQTKRTSLLVPSSVSLNQRDKVIYFPRNTNVSEALETALDRFGIVEGVVDGGDDVEDKLSKRRSISRVRYSLAVRYDPIEGQEYALSPSSKLLEAYQEPPIFKTYDRNSKEFRRRSMDAPGNSASQSDIQPSDPIFVIRKANRPVQQHTDNAKTSGELVRPSLQDRQATGASSRSVYSTPMSELPPDLEERAMSPQQTRQEIIAAQRATLRANQQRAIISAQKNSHNGVDVTMQDRSMIRSSNDGTNRTRYSYLGTDGTELDISELIESEWKQGDRQVSTISGSGETTPTPARDTPSVLSHVTTDSYASALTSPLASARSIQSGLNEGRVSYTDDENAEERVAVDKLAYAPINIGGSGNDYLEEALRSTASRQGAASPAFSQSSMTTTGTNAAGDSVSERLDRVLSKVRSGSIGSQSGGATGVASALRNQQQSLVRKLSDTRAASLGRTSPAPNIGSQDPSSSITRSRSTSQSTANGRASPSVQNVERTLSGRSTPVLDAPPPSSNASTPRVSMKPVSQHRTQSSLASIASNDSNGTAGSTSSTPATATSAGNTTTTPVSSTRNDSASSTNRMPVPYRDDNGLAFLMHLVDLDAPEPRLPRRTKLSTMQILQGVEHPKMSDELESIYAQPKQKLDSLEARLDQLLDQVLAQAK